MVTDNYKAAIKLYKTLNVPADTMDILKEVLPNEKTWNIILSARARGKTTNILLWGICLHEKYGIEIQYIRQREQQIQPKYSEKLFEIINNVEYGYVEKLTNGAYNTIKVFRRKAYFSKVDDEGNEIERAEQPFLTFLCVEKNLDYKSGYNAPNGDFIVFDEFLTTAGYLTDEFPRLNDLLSTIIRSRETAHIYLLGNLIDRYSIYFDELQLNDIISEINYGEHRHLQCGDTTLHLFMLPKTSEKQTKINLKYFSWLNPKLNAITTNTGLWALNIYPKPPKGDFIRLARRQIHLNGKYITLEMRYSNTDGSHYVFCFAENYDNTIIQFDIDNGAYYNQLYRYGFGYTETDKYFYQLYKLGRYYFSNNSVGALFESYIKRI